MKIAVYTIALNEEQRAQQFMDAHRNADLVVVGDTGSTDNTRQLIKDNGGHVVPIRVIPWRFDTPRNALMALLPEDIDLCLAIDLDERLQPGWRELVEENWRVGEHNRLRFRYVHGYNPDGSEGVVGMKDFAHARACYTWKHAVHEKLYYIGPGEENILTLADLTVEHHQHRKDTRSLYTPLLELECREGQPTHQHLFWLAREYVYQEDWHRAAEWFGEFLKKEKAWYVERAHAMRYLAKCFAKTDRISEARQMYLQSIEAAPKEREVWLDLAFFHAEYGELDLAYYACVNGLKITQRPEHYLSTPDAWGYKIYDLACRCAWNMGLNEQAKEYAKIAVTIAPDVQHVRETAEGLGIEIEYEVE